MLNLLLQHHKIKKLKKIRVAYIVRSSSTDFQPNMTILSISPMKNPLKRRHGSITVAAMEDQNLLNIETVYAVRGVCTNF